ncbi:hypothetical protein DL96DRAFT_1551939 [Flagelloscypha sp. PMI_526]|nr:hypothetical protein DL96DRAFT_1551939 [Flagelloscypha sp. PMI_526]
MSPFYSFTPNSTSIEYPWPVSLTGTERVMLAAQGNLQKCLSAFFARPIGVTLVYANTFSTTKEGQYNPTTLPDPELVQSASKEQPAFQRRQVYLECNGKIVCTCTSSVTMSNPTVANLFLVEKYPIGQTFSKLGKAANFELVEVGFGEPPSGTGKEEPQGPTKPTDDSALWRRYRLFVEDFECDILEVFPSRRMFSFGEPWLTGTLPLDARTTTSDSDWKSTVLRFSLIFLFALWIAILFLHRSS